MPLSESWVIRNIKHFSNHASLRHLTTSLQLPRLPSVMPTRQMGSRFPLSVCVYPYWWMPARTEGREGGRERERENERARARENENENENERAREKTRERTRARERTREGENDWEREGESERERERERARESCHDCSTVREWKRWDIKGETAQETRRYRWATASPPRNNKPFVKRLAC